MGQSLGSAIAGGVGRALITDNLRRAAAQRQQEMQNFQREIFTAKTDAEAAAAQKNKDFLAERDQNRFAHEIELEKLRGKYNLAGRKITSNAQLERDNQWRADQLRYRQFVSADKALFGDRIDAIDSEAQIIRRSDIVDNDELFKLAIEKNDLVRKRQEFIARENPQFQAPQTSVSPQELQEAGEAIFAPQIEAGIKSDPNLFKSEEPDEQAILDKNASRVASQLAKSRTASHFRTVNAKTTAESPTKLGQQVAGSGRPAEPKGKTDEQTAENNSKNTKMVNRNQAKTILAKNGWPVTEQNIKWAMERYAADGTKVN